MKGNNRSSGHNDETSCLAVGERMRGRSVYINGVLMDRFSAKTDCLASVSRSSTRFFGACRLLMSIKFPSTTVRGAVINGCSKCNQCADTRRTFRNGQMNWNQPSFVIGLFKNGSAVNNRRVHLIPMIINASPQNWKHIGRKSFDQYDRKSRGILLYYHSIKYKPSSMLDKTLNLRILGQLNEPLGVKFMSVFYCQRLGWESVYLNELFFVENHLQNRFQAPDLRCSSRIRIRL